VGRRSPAMPAITCIEDLRVLYVMRDRDFVER
jgi:hypothetical protein